MRAAIIAFVLAITVGSCATIAPNPAASGTYPPRASASGSASPQATPAPPLVPPSPNLRVASVARWPLAGTRPPNSDEPFRIPILTYHRISTPPAGPVAFPNLWVPSDLFRQQLQALVAAGWHTITVAQLAADLEAGRPPVPRTFAITIDDGNQDGFTNAFPTLVALRLVATYYVVTGRLGEPGDLTRDEIARLASAGMEIGDHTVDHVNLTRLSGTALERQIVEAEFTIQSIVGERPATFAYPFSDWDPGVVSGVARAGFDAAVINREVGPVDWTNRFLIPRLEVGPTTTPAHLVAEADSAAPPRT